MYKRRRCRWEMGSLRHMHDQEHTVHISPSHPLVGIKYTIVFVALCGSKHSCLPLPSCASVIDTQQPSPGVANARLEQMRWRRRKSKTGTNVVSHTICGTVGRKLVARIWVRYRYTAFPCFDLRDLPHEKGTHDDPCLTCPQHKSRVA